MRFTLKLMSQGKPPFMLMKVVFRLRMCVGMLMRPRASVSQINIGFTSVSIHFFDYGTTWRLLYRSYAFSPNRRGMGRQRPPNCEGAQISWTHQAHAFTHGKISRVGIDEVHLAKTQSVLLHDFILHIRQHQLSEVETCVASDLLRRAAITLTGSF